jgi:hypothetical protein
MELGNDLSFALLDKYVCKAYHILYTHKDINFPMLYFNHFFIELIGAFPSISISVLGRCHWRSRGNL